MKRLQKNKNSGSVLVLAICILVVLLVLGIGYLSLASQSRLFAIHDSSAIVARSAADAGLTRIAYECNVELSRYKNAGGSFTRPAGQTGLALENSPDGTYDCSTPTYLSGTDFTYGFSISSTGYYHGAQSNLNAFLVLSGGPFKYALFADSFISMHNNDYVTWNKVTYPNLDSPLKVGANGHGASSPFISIDKGNIDGNVEVPPGVNPKTAIDADVSGQEYAATDPIDLPPKTVPTDIVWTVPTPSDLTGDKTLLGGDSQHPGNYEYTNINKTGGGGILTINGNVNLYVTGDISSTNIKIDTTNANSALTLYLAGSFDDKNGFTLGTWTDPTKLVIYGISTGTQSITIDLAKNNGNFYGAIYAPNAAVTMKNNGNVDGAIIAKSFTVQNNLNFIYDPRVRFIISAPGNHFVLSRWSEASSRTY